MGGSIHLVNEELSQYYTGRNCIVHNCIGHNGLGDSDVGNDYYMGGSSDLVTEECDLERDAPTDDRPQRNRSWRDAEEGHKLLRDRKALRLCPRIKRSVENNKHRGIVAARRRHRGRLRGR